jgi:hypothetical protein
MEKIRNTFKIQSRNLEGRYRSRDVGLYKSIILKWILEPLGMRMLTEFKWLRIGSRDELLVTRQSTLEFHKRHGISSAFQQ